MESFQYVFQLSKKIVFEVSYYRLGNNTNKDFSTSASEFNQPKSNYNRCGQAQNDLLKDFPLAMDFYKNLIIYICKI